MLKKSGLIYIFILLFFSFIKITAHPHLFLNYYSTFVFEGEQFKGIRIKWYFDEMFSASSKDLFDTNQDGKLDETELAEFKATTYSGIKEFNFFIKLYIDGKRKYIKDLQNFKIFYETGSQLVYTFFIPCNVPLTADITNIKLLFEDETYYTAICTEQTEIYYQSNNQIEVIKEEVIDQLIQKVQFRKK